MELILHFPVKPPAAQINLKDTILLMGSCFAEEIGQKMHDRRFNVHINPHGILYNPLSLAQAADDYLTAKVYSQDDLIQHDGLWHSFRHHGRFSQPDADAVLQHINSEIGRAHAQLKAARWLILTFGSAFVYQHKKSSAPVANCHKVPAAEFEKLLLNKQTIVTAWEEQLQTLKKSNPQLNILFTISPVRYVRDGVVENNRSKGILIDALHTLVERHSNCFYFPAYEIVIDELRDYRFFKDDLVHPNHLAVNYVWEKFAGAMCDPATRQFLAEYEPLHRGLQHRPLQQNSAEHQRFRVQLEENTRALEKKYGL